MADATKKSGEQSRHNQAMARNHQQHRAMEVMALRSVREPCRSTAISEAYTQFGCRPKGTDNAKHRILDFFLYVREADNSSAWQTNRG
jgi:hypothetical protein